MTCRQRKQKTIVLALIICISVLLVACGVSSKDSDESDLSSGLYQVVITVDGQNYIIEDAKNRTLQELFQLAKISVNKGDVISVADNISIENGIEVRILRFHTVSVEVSENDVEKQYIVGVAGGTVSDALSMLGIEVQENQIVSVSLDAALENGMIIRIEKVDISSTEEESASTEEESPSEEETEAETQPVYRPQPTKPTQPAPTKPTEPSTVPTTDAETQPSKIVVSIQYYDDCDGSGHGVKVITYSDGSQEEIEY